MHPWITSDKPGKCPICGMDLIPVYESKEAKGQKPTAKEKGSHVQLTKKQLENINLQTETVAKRSLFLDLRLAGEIAYDPDLLVAEEEFVAATYAGDSDLAELAKRKLLVLGLSKEEIDQLAKTFKVDSNLLLPEARMWVYADIYEHELSWAKVGNQVQITSVTYPGETFSGWIRSIDPILKAKTRTAKLRIEVNNPKLKLKPQMYVDVYLSSTPRRVLAVPKEAVIDTGLRRLAYVEKAPGIYEPRELKLGPEADVLVKGHKVKFFPVILGISAGEKVVTGASFLIDSQSQLTGGSSALYGGASEVNNHDRKNH
ncbi:MAG: efflux RND transporter periplasmic adaptor subunit, partial [Candidatus Saganbacteria bacterium]|nr:efflux RND transporter periplasmic adaptor subunit [Candidatus Saganbacteria bacterium]